MTGIKDTKISAQYHKVKPAGTKKKNTGTWGGCKYHHDNIIFVSYYQITY